MAKFVRNPTEQEYRLHLDLIYRSIQNPNLWNQVGQLLTQRFGFNSSSIFLGDKQKASIRLIEQTGIDPQQIDIYNQDYVHQDKITASLADCFQANPQARFFSSVDVPNAKAMYRSCVAYQEWSRPNGLLDFTGMIFHQDHQQLLSFGLQTSNRLGTVRESTVTLLNRYAIHLRRAARLSFAPLLKSAPSQLQMFRFAINSKKQIVDINETTSLLLNSYTGEYLIDGRLHFTRHPKLNLLIEQALINLSRPWQNTSANSCSILCGLANWNFFLVPERLSSKTPGLQIYIDVAPHRYPGVLQTLTPTENLVLMLLLEGLDYYAIADKLCSSIHTVRSHLKHIYRKADAHSHIDLLRRLTH